MVDLLPILSGVAIAVIGSGAGWAAWRRASSESEKDRASASRDIVGGAGDLAKLLREQMAEMDDRLERVEYSVGLWENWAERVLDLLDRALGMIASEHAAAFRAEVEEAKRTRPARNHQAREDS